MAVPTATPSGMAVPTATPSDMAVPTATPSDMAVPTATPSDMAVPTATPSDMAVPTATPSQRTPQVVGAAFVQQYYHVLHKTPEMVHKFYQDCSLMSRPDSDGEMSQVTSLKAINEKVLSFKFNSYIAEIETVDSLASYMEGVLIVVTGCLTASDNVRRKFTQSFFLAPQDKGYFVLSDNFRFVDQSQPEESNQSLANDDSDDASKASLTATPELSLIEENHVEVITTPALEGEHVNHEEVVNPSESCRSGVEDEAAIVSPVRQSQSNDQLKCETAAPVVQDNGLKKSYASIVKVMGSSTPLKKISTPATKAKAKAVSPSIQKPLNTSNKHATASEQKVPSSNNGPDKSPDAVEGYSIHIANLPSSSTTELVEEVFKKFGPIKPGGVQVRNHKIDNFCFGFVEFESLDSMQAAIKASPISIGGRLSAIEEKRTTTRVVNGVVISSGNWRGRYPQGRSGFRNDNFRGNDNYRGNVNNYRSRGGSSGGDGQGYARMDFSNRGDYSGRGRGRGPPGTIREGYQQQRPIQNGNGRMARPVAVTS